MTAGGAVNNIQIYLIRIFGLLPELNLLPGCSGAVRFMLCFCILQICFRSASDQACLWAFSATGLGVLDDGFKGALLHGCRGKDMMGRWDASKNLFLGTL